MSAYLQFTEKDSILANVTWGANCGPHALAASTRSTLDRVRPHLVGFESKLYTNPTMMENALNLMGINWDRKRGLKTKERPVHGMARVQWEGRWLNPGVPKMVAYQHTHWIACSTLPEEEVFCTVMPAFGWCSGEQWTDYLDRWCPANGYTGWHITHHYDFADPVPF